MGNAGESVWGSGVARIFAGGGGEVHLIFTSKVDDFNLVIVLNIQAILLNTHSHPPPPNNKILKNLTSRSPRGCTYNLLL